MRAIHENRSPTSARARNSVRFLAAVVVAQAPALAQCEIDKLLAQDGDAGDRFGLSTAVLGKLAVVGAPSDDDNGTDSGSAYIFDLASQNQLLKLTADDGLAGDEFGHSNVLLFDRVLVGAPFGNGAASDSGCVYVIDSVTGAVLSKIFAADGEPDDMFGSYIAASADRLIASAVYDDDNGTNSGSAYVFDLSTGQELLKLTPGDGEAGDAFGFSVAILGDWAVVGARHDDDFGETSGSAYVFDLTTGSEVFKLVPAGSAAGDAFGNSVGLTADRVVVSAWGVDDGGDRTGAVYVFDLATGQELLKIKAEDPSDQHAFGHSIAVAGGLVAVGAYNDDDKGMNAGAVYVFDLQTGQQVLKFTAPDGEAGDNLGWFKSLSMDEGAVVVGALYDDDSGTDSGSAYAWTLSGLGSSYCVATPNSSGLPATIAACGSPVISHNWFRLTTVNVPPNQFGYYFMSDAQGFVPFFGGSQGNLCLGPPIIRFNRPPTGEVLFSGPDGILNFQPDLTNLPQNTVFLPGDTWNFQSWFRDVVGPNFTSNTSNGVAITWQ